MQQLIATQSYPFGRRSLKAGDKFEASDEEARLLKGFGKARAVDATQSAAPVTSAVLTRALAAGDPTASDDGLFDQSGEKRKRTYRRRDMVAEG
jgi:hypothetical protein